MLREVYNDNCLPYQSQWRKVTLLALLLYSSLWFQKQHVVIHHLILLLIISHVYIGMYKLVLRYVIMAIDTTDHMIIMFFTLGSKRVSIKEHDFNNKVTRLLFYRSIKKHAEYVAYDLNPAWSRSLDLLKSGWLHSLSTMESITGVTRNVTIYRLGYL